MKPQELAKLTIETYIKTGNTPEEPETLEDVKLDKAGVFVSLKTKEGELRGCIGTLFPNTDSVKQEIIKNAVSASTRDPRFSAVTEDELENLKYSVDVMHKLEIMDTLEDLDPKIYGIVINSETGKKGLLLPDLEGVETIEDQLEICKRKSGMTDTEKFSLHRFKVDRYSEE